MLCSCLALYSDAWSIEKNMLKHPRRVIREHLRCAAVELNKKARVNRLVLSLKVLRHSLLSRE